MPKKDVIIACDFATKQDTLAFLGQFTGQKPFVKIGMELFYGEGPDIVREIKARGHKIFLDLKLHDIPNTVHKAMKNLAGLGVDMTNLHAGGGTAMMRAALEGFGEGAAGSRALLIAVTQLTSTSREVMNGELLVPGEVEAVVAAYAANAKAAGLDGVVCSPLEAGVVKARCGSEFLTVTPGIRYPEGEKGDQSRVTTPADAAKIGSDYIVVGRPITAAANPVQAYLRCLQDFAGI
ncbi:MAG: orotidine-5'-phosphate decarboxylase [Oscillospiraceae bacterium]